VILIVAEIVVVRSELTDEEDYTNSTEVQHKGCVKTVTRDSGNLSFLSTFYLLFIYFFTYYDWDILGISLRHPWDMVGISQRFLEN